MKSITIRYLAVCAICAATTQAVAGNTTRPPLVVVDSTSGCPSTEGSFVALLDPDRGMLLLSAAEFPGGHVAGQANGMVGYVPHAEAFRRGGYETTLCNSSRLAPEAGNILADAAIELIEEQA